MKIRGLFASPLLALVLAIASPAHGAADVGIAVKGAGVGTATTASGTSQTTGSTFYVFTLWDSFSTFTSIADNKGNTASYTLVGSETASGSFKSRLYRCVNCAGGAGHTATIVVSGGGQPTVFLVEVTGCDTSSPVDQSDRRADNSSPYTLAAGLTTTQSTELLLSFFAGDSGSNPTTIAESGLGSSTIVVSETNGSANWTGAVAKSHKTATGTFNPSWTSSGASNTAVFLETLKEAGGGGGGGIVCNPLSGRCGTAAPAMTLH